MEFAVIDFNQNPMVMDQGRGLGFVRALDRWSNGKDFEFVRFEAIHSRRQDMMQCRGMILSGSRFDLALPDGGFDRGCYQKMIPMFQLMRDFPGPVLGICFGHQLMALADEFEPGRTEFSNLQIRNMKDPRDQHQVALVRMKSPLRFMEQRDFWVQYNHKQEVLKNDGLLKYYEIVAGSNRCPVEIMQHRSREWFGVQFHPEIGKPTQDGEIARHAEAEKDGQTLLQQFVHYCLSR